MNGFADRGLDEAAFGEKKGITEGLRTFDAFPKTKPTYTRRTSSGGYATLTLLIISFFLVLSELMRWYHGHEIHNFSVEKGVSHTLQINLDIVIPMRCADIHINVQDAAGDRILAADMLTRQATSWAQWLAHDTKTGDLVVLEQGGGQGRERAEEEDTHVGHVLGEVRRKRSFKSTPRLKGAADSCRVFGSLEGNKVQGDFRITARGHGYMELGEHLDHAAFNFSHIINELSFGPLYPSLLNPLDRTITTTVSHFFKYQYYLSIVPTIYTRSPTALTSPAAALYSRNTVITNQYAVTSQSYMVGERSIPGVFFKFDIEPVLLMIAEERGGLLALLVRVVNVISGVLVGGGWCYQLAGWLGEVWWRRKRGGEGVLHGREEVEEDG